MRRDLVILLASALAPGLCAQNGFLFESNDAGELVAKAQQGVGSGSIHSTVGALSSPFDIDLFLFRVTNPNTFSASTDVPITQGANGIVDTQLFLFDCHGRGITFNDDISSTNLRSRITGQYLTAGGVYCCAVTSFGNHPRNAANQKIWNHNNSWTTERPPDGPGASNPVLDNWDHAGTESGLYGIMVTGVELLGFGAPVVEPRGVGCGGLELCPETLPILGSSFDFTLAGPTGGLSACLARPGVTSPPTFLPAPVAPFCFNYLGNSPGVNLGLTTQNPHEYAIVFPNLVIFQGMPIAIQGARFLPNLSQVHTSNALEALVGDCN